MMRLFFFRLRAVSQVFTGNLAYSTTESGLKELFQPFASDV